MTKREVIIILALLAIATIVNYWIKPNKEVTLKSTEIKVERMYDINDPYTEEKVKEYLKQLHVKFPNVAVAQMKLESANGTSKVFNENNNLFGMKLAERRPTTALGSRNNHAYYSHWRQSCIDYALWQSFVSNPENVYSESSWLSYVSKFYSQDDTYRLKITKIKNGL